MYGQNYNRYGSPMPQRPGGVDLDELRQRRAVRNERMAPLPIPEMPESSSSQRQGDSGGGSGLGQFLQMPLRGLPQMPGAGSLPNGGFTTPPLVPSTQRPSVAFEPRQSPIPTVPALGASTSGPPQMPAGDMEFNPPRLTRMPPQAAPAGPQGTAPTAAPTRPDPREIAQQEAMARTSSADPISQAQEQAGMRSKRGFWDILKTAGVGALQGLSSGQGLGGALGGALAGGTIAAISPRRGGEYRFNMMERPRMEEEMNRRMQQEQFRRQQEQASLAGQKTAAEIQELQAKAADIPGRTTSQRAREAAQTEYYKGRAEAVRNPAPRPTRGDFALEVGADGKMYRIDRQTGNATPVEGFRPAPSGRGGRGGGGGGEDGERLTRSALNLEAETENARLKAEDFMSQLNAMKPDDSEEYAALKVAAEDALRKYNDSVRKLGMIYGDRYEIGPGLTPEGKPSRFMYYQRR